MLYVYQLPQKLSNGYCFAGPVPITFGNVDWLYTPEESMTRQESEEFLRGKNYFKNAPKGTKFLVLCEDRPDHTFMMVKS